MFGVILGIHIVICLGLIIVVLLQSGKGGGLAGAFGGAGGVGAVFGGQAAATFLTKATRYLAIGFMLSSLSLAVTLRGNLRGGTVSDGLEGRQPSAATTAGEIVPQEGAPSELPSAGTGTESGVEATGTEEQGGVTGDEIPVAPETE
ncbi:MAG: preprotein translocase subunit SecG [Candidatus Eisenbacteria sp.]|nr:preprotein translocase subunit SecG [Candidatus Eisenbacteria bacterium]